MANNELKTKLVIEADARGDDASVKLQRELDKLGAATDQASPEFAQLVDELKRLGEQAAITQFDQLKSATQETAEKLQQMQQAMSEAALALRVQDDALTKAAAISRFAAIVRPLNALHPMAPIDSGQQCTFATNDGGFDLTSSRFATIARPRNPLRPLRSMAYVCGHHGISFSNITHQLLINT